MGLRALNLTKWHCVQEANVKRFSTQVA